ncbi:hypothetical protein MBLNU457_5488t2 [Dothideomycetes sp. NU457]
MVDPLTAGTAIVGFLGFAGQFLDGVKKFREFCRDVKDAPSGTSQVAEGLALLHGILEQCGSLSQEASKVVNKRQRSFETGNVLSRVKAAITKDDITSLLANIERVKGSLCLLLNLLVVDVLRSQLSKHEQAISSLTSEVHLLKDASPQVRNTHFLYEVHVRSSTQSSAPNITLHQPLVQDYEQSPSNGLPHYSNVVLYHCDRPHNSTNPRSTESPSCQIDSQHLGEEPVYELPRQPNFGFYQLIVQGQERIFDADDPRSHRPIPSRKRSRAVKLMNSVRIQLPMGILPYMLEINWGPVGGGWKHTFSTQRIVPDDCPFFNAIWEGNTETADRLLGTGEAFLTDVNPSGRTIVEQMLEICMSDKHTKKTTYSKLARSAVFILRHPTCPKFEDIITTAATHDGVTSSIHGRYAAKILQRKQISPKWYACVLRM